MPQTAPPARSGSPSDLPTATAPPVTIANLLSANRSSANHGCKAPGSPTHVHGRPAAAPRRLEHSQPARTQGPQGPPPPPAQRREIRQHTIRRQYRCLSTLSTEHHQLSDGIAQSRCRRDLDPLQLVQRTGVRALGLAELLGGHRPRGERLGCSPRAHPPDLWQKSRSCPPGRGEAHSQRGGAHGIEVHPTPSERHPR